MKNQAQKRYYERHKQRILKRDKARRDRLGRHVLAHGLTDAEFSAKVAAQAGVCAICGLAPAKWVLDHDHRYSLRQPEGHRGVLCGHCNLMLGHAKENPATLRAAAAYLERWSHADDQAAA